MRQILCTMQKNNALVCSFLIEEILLQSSSLVSLFYIKLSQRLEAKGNFFLECFVCFVFFMSS